MKLNFEPGTRTELMLQVIIVLLEEQNELLKPKEAEEVKEKEIVVKAPIKRRTTKLKEVKKDV